ncbi:hypothetical protein [Aestuariicoccus sp. MJ-SS9]|uniref:hypothetical protein n=1 Tax=Aestuariicoccus sp. MJ-SS9 TaxID=3079855 RepID=UPI002913AE0B|nr:hypothetical protein [Aestuariicoccus sp. MJ-SS9]MDU8911363.1 hypothetical protein [Aestuariicoccus sp. MJ-SS9]
MAKLIAILNVVAWSGFWAFGYLALTADPSAPGAMTMAALLAALGGAMGLWAWFWLARHSEEIGYAKPSRSRPRNDTEEHAG